jgi:hypothetical protein
MRVLVDKVKNLTASRCEVQISFGKPREAKVSFNFSVAYALYFSVRSLIDIGGYLCCTYSIF